MWQWVLGLAAVEGLFASPCAFQKCSLLGTTAGPTEIPQKEVLCAFCFIDSGQFLQLKMVHKYFKKTTDTQNKTKNPSGKSGSRGIATG